MQLFRRAVAVLGEPARIAVVLGESARGTAVPRGLRVAGGQPNHRGGW
ncbi:MULTISPECIES: hypothetical protein [unclassified Kribbella]